MVIVFANQKGGVGKTTLAILFANYLIEKKVNVIIVDVDRQRSILSQRYSDRDAFINNEIKYNVEEWDIENKKDSEKLISMIEKIDNRTVIIIDTPGSIAQDGLIPIFVRANYIICPYMYDKRSLESTGVFIQIITEMEKRIDKMRKNIFFLPNHVDKRLGTKEEKELWEETDKVFQNYGNVTPQICYKSSLKRINTYFLSDEQREEVKESFNYIINKIDIL